MGEEGRAEHPDELTLGDILREAIDRRRSGERPTASEYAEKYPHLRKEIEADFCTIELLEGSSPDPPGRPESMPIAKIIAGQSPLVQRMIFLRNFRKLRWEEITGLLGRPEAELRRSYASALREILECCSSGEGS